MPDPNRWRIGWAAALLLSALAVPAAQAQDADDLLFQSAHDVNEGALKFLVKPPARALHHHQNRLRIDAASLDTGWVHLNQCHDNLDAVPRLQITFREGFVRNLKVVSFSNIENAWIDGPSVQLVNIGGNARLCLAADTRALRNTGNGYFTLYSGPYMRKFLDGYYPMRVSLDIEYPTDQLSVLDISPTAQPGFTVDEAPGRIQLDAVFEGELATLIQFEKKI